MAWVPAVQPAGGLDRTSGGPLAAAVPQRDGLREGWSSFLVFILVVSLMLLASAAIGLFVALRRHRIPHKPR